MAGTIHIIGAGLAGLAAAVRLAQSPASSVVHEATRQAGGRCRSYDDAATGMTIDNGNHLVLSGNRAARDYLETIGADTISSARPKPNFRSSILPAASAGPCG